MKSLLVVAVVGCGGGPLPLSSDAPSRPPQPAVVEADEPECAARWSDFALPDVIPLQPIGPIDDSRCPIGFDPAARLISSCPTCLAGSVTGGKAVVELGDADRLTRPYGIVVDGVVPRFACLEGGMLGGRHFSTTHRKPHVPALSDLDGDGSFELVVWGDLPVGPSNWHHASVPVVYEIDHDRLRRRDDVARGLAREIVRAYRTLAADRRESCYVTMADAIEARFDR